MHYPHSGVVQRAVRITEFVGIVLRLVFRTELKNIRKNPIFEMPRHVLNTSRCAVFRYQGILNITFQCHIQSELIKLFRQEQ